jgi:vacuolar ATPase assembly integral membrane protein VMA21
MNRPVLFKLGLFTAALGVGPIATYYASQEYLWKGMMEQCLLPSYILIDLWWTGNSTYAAITAIVTANVVLVSYIIASIREDQAPAQRGKDVVESKKDR